MISLEPVHHHIHRLVRPHARSVELIPPVGAAIQAIDFAALLVGEDQGSFGAVFAAADAFNGIVEFSYTIFVGVEKIDAGHRGAGAGRCVARFARRIGQAAFRSRGTGSDHQQQQRNR